MENNKPIVLTYCDKYHKNGFENTSRYINTLNNNNWDYIILGGETDIWEGYMTKIKAYKKYLETIEPNKIVVVTDAHDVYCLRNSSSFVENFKKNKYNMIVSMELLAEGYIQYDKNKIYRQVTWLDKYFKYHNINYGCFMKKFVNSGLICGYSKDLLDCFNYMIDNNYNDDQKALGDYMNKYPDKVFADLESNIFDTCVSLVNAGIESYSQVLHSPSLNELIGQKSFFIHIPGINCSKGQMYLYNKIYEILKIFTLEELKTYYPQYDLDKFYEYYNV